MRSRLLSLLLAWAEKESIRMVGRGLRIPDSKYVWIKDALGRYHFGCYGPFRVFIQGQAAFTLIPGTAPQDLSKTDEFCAAFRKLDETSQGLIIMAYLGGDDEWRNYLGDSGLKSGQAEKWLRNAVLHLMRECRRRGLL